MKIKNPKVTITFVNEGADYTFEAYWINDDNKIIFDNITIEAGQTRDVECIFMQIFEDGDKLWESIELSGSASDLVNCTFDDGQLLITDPTKDASATITVSGDE